jgi:hypothetical protein
MSCVIDQLGEAVITFISFTQISRNNLPIMVFFYI